MTTTPDKAPRRMFVMLPADLFEGLQAGALRNGGSVNSEIVRRLRDSDPNIGSTIAEMKAMLQQLTGAKPKLALALVPVRAICSPADQAAMAKEVAERAVRGLAQRQAPEQRRLRGALQVRARRLALPDDQGHAADHRALLNPRRSRREGPPHEPLANPAMTQPTEINDKWGLIRAMQDHPDTRLYRLPIVTPSKSYMYELRRYPSQDVLHTVSSEVYQHCRDDGALFVHQTSRVFTLMPALRTRAPNALSPHLPQPQEMRQNASHEPRRPDR